MTTREFLTLCICTLLLLAWLEIQYGPRAYGAPIATASSQSVTVTLFDEPCAVPEVSNLPNRATWRDGAKTFEGCFASAGGIVVAYFREDRSVVVIPAQAFQKVTGA